MNHRTQGRVRRQFDFARQQLQQAPALPFAQLLDPELVSQAFATAGVCGRQCLYAPHITLSIFLSQVIDPISCCLQAVARFLAHRVAAGLAPCSPETGAYCQARQRLPEAVLVNLTRATGQHLHDRELPGAWLWKGRPVKIADGTGVSMPDTPANQAAYPQQRTQKPGLGFPAARLVLLVSLSIGTVLDAALAPGRGKRTGELTLFRSMLDRFQPGDVALGDRIFCDYFTLALMQPRGVDMVVRLHQSRRADFRRGRRLGANDHVVVWRKPRCPDWLDEATYEELPATLELRELKVVVREPGFRTKRLVVVTTLLDAEEFSAEEIADLYRARWHAELDLRSLKQALQLDVLRCQSPEMVRKEVWAHLLAYNLIRRVMADAAEKHGVLPRELSFKGALETLLAFLPYLEGPHAAECYEQMLDALVHHRVGDRPGRWEPRVRKRRSKNYPYMKRPRAVDRRRMVATRTT
jgi:hypothetical protein